MDKIASAGGYSVLIPKDVTDTQVDAIRMVLYHGATTCSQEWAAFISRKDDALRSADRHLRAALADVQIGSTAHKAIAAVLRHIEAG